MADTGALRSERGVAKCPFLRSPDGSAYGRVGSRLCGKAEKTVPSEVPGCQNRFVAISGGRVFSWYATRRAGTDISPEPSGKGPKIHFIVREPSGIRIEFAFDPRLERPR